MKEKIIATSILVVIISFVFINTILLDKEIKKIANDVNELQISDTNSVDSERRAREIYDRYKRRETFISLTVNHEDLTNIEEGFDEIIGYLSVNDTDGALVIKSRLIGSLEHLRRLSGFTIDAII